MICIDLSFFHDHKFHLEKNNVGITQIQRNLHKLNFHFDCPVYILFIHLRKNILLIAKTSNSHQQIPSHTADHIW